MKASKKVLLAAFTLALLCMGANVVGFVIAAFLGNKLLALWSAAWAIFSGVLASRRGSELVS